MLLLPHARHAPEGRRPVGTPARWRAALRRSAPGGWTGLAVGAVMLLTLIPGNRGLLRLVGLLRDRAALRVELGDLEVRRVKLLEELRKLTSDAATIERLAREKLDLARKGETVYKFPPAE